MNYPDLTICVPAYNEGRIIFKTLRELRSIFTDAEIIVVDDGSDDDTAEQARTDPTVIVFQHRRNLGYGAALKSAIRRASRKYIAWYDADGQHKPEDLARVVAPVIVGTYEFVVGVRGRGSNKRIERIPGKLVLHGIVRMVARQSVPDINSGMRCFQTDIIKKYMHLLPDGFSASTTSTLLMIKQRYQTGYVGITTEKRVGTSSARIFRDGWYTLGFVFRTLVLFEAFRFFSVLALMQIGFALIYGFYVAIVNELGFPVFASMIFISGVLTLFMGILCDQIVCMRKEKFEMDE